MSVRHKPVMVDEVLNALAIKSGGRYIDCTVGEGGHASAILGATDSDSKLLGLDLDAGALSIASKRLENYENRVNLSHGNFTTLKESAHAYDFVPADGVLFDLGMSSLQLETTKRGFSFARSGPLDMRFDSVQKLTAYDLVNRYPEPNLADIIHQFGEEKRARRLARSIVRARPIESTIKLAEIIANTLGKSNKQRIHPATRTFQAIRIAVNHELENLKEGLKQAIKVVGTTGRLVVISYHSLEDRIVKGVFRREGSTCICPSSIIKCICSHQATIKIITKKVVKPSQNEIQVNPRSRSARLRVAELL